MAIEWTKRSELGQGHIATLGAITLSTLKSHNDLDGWCWYAMTPDQFGSDGDATLSSGRFFETEEAAKDAALAFAHGFASAVLANFAAPSPEPKVVAASNGVRKIEINFAEAVELTDDIEQQLLQIAGEICRAYELAHPGRVMWPAGIGGKITFMPLTAEDERERGIEFDDDTFEIDCYAREGERARHTPPPWRPQHPSKTAVTGAAPQMLKPTVVNVSWGAC